MNRTYIIKSPLNNQTLIENYPFLKMPLASNKNIMRHYTYFLYLTPHEQGVGAKMTNI